MKTELTILSGFTCNTCGKIFNTEEEFNNRHKRKVVKEDFINNLNSIDLSKK